MPQRIRSKLLRLAEGLRYLSVCPCPRRRVRRPRRSPGRHFAEVGRRMAAVYEEMRRGQA